MSLIIEKRDAASAGAAVLIYGVCGCVWVCLDGTRDEQSHHFRRGEGGACCNLYKKQKQKPNALNEIDRYINSVTP